MAVNLRELVANERDLVALISVLRGETLAEIGFKILVLRKLVDTYKPGQCFSPQELMIQLEDLQVPYTEQQILALVRSTGLVETTQAGTLTVRQDLLLGQIFQRELRGRSEAVPLAELRELRVTREKRRSETEPVECIAALERSALWATEVIDYCLSRDLPGVPVFWLCETSGHRPLMNEIGTSTTVDAVMLLLQAADSGVFNPLLRDNNVPILIQGMLRAMLAFQREEPAWARGGFAVWGPDEDFVGAFQQEHPERGSCPTVDGTADAVLALAHAVAIDELREFAQSLAGPIREGVGFLVRQQQQAGAWGVYRYEDDRHDMDPRPESSALVVEALAAACRSHVLPGAMTPLCREPVTRYVDFVATTAFAERDEWSWAANFARHDGNNVDQSFGATLWVARSLQHLALTLLPQEMRVRDLLDGAVRYLARRWQPNPLAFVSAVFHIPSWDRPADAEFSWELPLDALIATLLLDHATNFTHALPSATWSKVMRVVGSALADERHGHWFDYLMRQRNHEDRAVPGNTRYFDEMLIAYLRFLSAPHRLSDLFGAQRP